MIIYYLPAFTRTRIIHWQGSLVFFQITRGKDDVPKGNLNAIPSFFQELYTLPETNSSHLKMDGWKKMILSFPFGAKRPFSGAIFASLVEGIPNSSILDLYKQPNADSFAQLRGTAALATRILSKIWDSNFSVRVRYGRGFLKKEHPFCSHCHQHLSVVKFVFKFLSHTSA